MNNAKAERATMEKKELTTYIAITEDDKIAIYQSEWADDEEAPKIIIRPEDLEAVLECLIDAKNEIEGLEE